MVMLAYLEAERCGRGPMPRAARWSALTLATRSRGDASHCGHAGARPRRGRKDRPGQLATTTDIVQGLLHSHRGHNSSTTSTQSTRLSQSALTVSPEPRLQAVACMLQPGLVEGAEDAVIHQCG